MKTLPEIVVADQRVLLRTDFDVPLQDGKVVDDSRIVASLPTLMALRRGGARGITIISHLGRPEGKVVDALKIQPVADHLRRLLPPGLEVEIAENLRFHPGEEENSEEFAKGIAAGKDLYVNDAFAVSHRPHASIVSVPRFLPACIGLNFEQELKALDKVRHNPQQPLLVVLGGAKLETKLPFINKIAGVADSILVGGKLAQEKDTLSLPSQSSAQLMVAALTPDGKDITLESASQFCAVIAKAGTVVWNGPMGVVEEVEHETGTKMIAEAVNTAPGYTVIGGGDTERAATRFHAEDGIDHISMGGGAMLQYLADGTLVGLQAQEGGQG